MIKHNSIHICLCLEAVGTISDIHCWYVSILMTTPLECTHWMFEDF